MNPVQLEGLARQVLPILGTLLAVFGISAATANTIVNTLLAIIGPLMAIASVLWDLFANKTSAVISKTAALPEVKEITLEPTVPSSMVSATPDNVTK